MYEQEFCPPLLDNLTSEDIEAATPSAQPPSVVLTTSEIPSDAATSEFCANAKTSAAPGTLTTSSSAIPANEHVRASGGTAATNSDAEEELELARLERRKRIADLQRELAEFEQNTCSGEKIDFTDVENAVPSFSGGYSYGVRKWIADFEDVAQSLGCDDRSKYTCARRLLQGTAKMLIRTVRVDAWSSLKRLLLEEFDKRLTRQEVYRQLNLRKRRREETLLHYV